MREAWSKQEIAHIIAGKQKGKSDAQLASELNRSFNSVNSKIAKMKKDGDLDQTPSIPKSPYPVLDDAPKLSGDFVIFPDIEAPFQHSDFMNRVIDLAHTWGVKQAILAGDFLHFEGLSAFGPGWAAAEPNEKMESLIDFIATLPKKTKEQGQELLENMGVLGEGTVVQELEHSKRVVKYMTSAFAEITYIMGNHDDRLIRRMDLALSVTGLADLIKAGETWKVSSYYWCEVDTDAGKFRISHPRTAANMAAADLAMQFQCHFLMGHSHKWKQEVDKSGKFWAMHMGHAVDERRLEYVMKRDAKRDQHALGAVILRGGYPWLLSERTPWKQMAAM